MTARITIIDEAITMYNEETEDWSGNTYGQYEGPIIFDGVTISEAYANMFDYLDVPEDERADIKNNIKENADYSTDVSMFCITDKDYNLIDYTIKGEIVKPMDLTEK